MRDAYYPGITSPSKLGLKLAGFAPPSSVGQPLEPPAAIDATAQRRRIVVGPARRAGGGAQTGDGAGAHAANAAVNTHPSAWPTLDFAEPSPSPSASLARQPAADRAVSTPASRSRDKARDGAGAQANGPKQRKTPAASGPATPTALDETRKARRAAQGSSVRGPAQQARSLVAVRVRPRVESERQHQQFEACIAVDHEQKSVEISRSFLNKKQYAFDAVFDESADTAQVYESLVHPLVLHVLEGYSAVVTAYGQSATGKTHTLGTDASSINSGCLLRACSALLQGLNLDYPGAGSQDAKPARIYVSVTELYNEELRDLLVADSDDRSRGRVIGVDARTHQLKGMSAQEISSADDCVALIRSSSRRRATCGSHTPASTAHLGHLLVKFIVERRGSGIATDARTPAPGSEGEPGALAQDVVRSSLSLVELAGSDWRDVNLASRAHVSGGRGAEDARLIGNALSSLSALMHARMHHLPLRGEVCSEREGGREREREGEREGGMERERE